MFSFNVFQYEIFNRMSLKFILSIEIIFFAKFQNYSKKLINSLIDWKFLLQTLWLIRPWSKIPHKRDNWGLFVPSGVENRVSTGFAGFAPLKVQMGPDFFLCYFWLVTKKRFWCISRCKNYFENENISLPFYSIANFHDIV